MVLDFRGTAHPPPRKDGKRSNIADLTAVEIGTTNLGARGGTQLLVEHDHGAHAGTVLSSWEGRDGSLRVSGVVDDPEAERLVRNGAMRGLSLGTSVIQTEAGDRLIGIQDELSICERPRRAGCYIDELDGRRVRSVDCASRQRETFSKEYVEQLKAQIAEKSKSEALLKAKFAGHEQRQRAMLAEMQPTVQEWINEGLEHGTLEDKHMMAPMSEFGANLHAADNLESAMPLARMISVHSARFKRKTEEFSQSASAAEQLSRANKELEEVKADRDAKATRLDALDKLVKDNYTVNAALTEQLAMAGAIRTENTFSIASSREKEAKQKAPFVDPLLSYVQKNGGGGARIGLSATNHHVLGAAGSSESSLQAALRVA